MEVIAHALILARRRTQRPPAPSLRRSATELARDFKPTAAQQQLLDWVRAHPGFQTVEQLCAAASISESSYYTWCRNPRFRAWFTREWSAALLFDGWHVLNLARANMVNSPTHFRFLARLLFDPKGQAALAGWANAATDGAPDDADLQTQVLSNQPNMPQNCSFSKPPAPSAVARSLGHTLTALDKASS